MGVIDWIFKGDEDDDYEVRQAEPKSSIYEQSLSTSTSEVVKKLSTGDSNLQLFEPRGYGDSIQIGRALKEKKGVVVNLHRLTDEQSRRIYDFLHGVIYAIDGDQKKLGERIYIFTPKNIGLDGNITLEEENN